MREGAWRKAIKEGAREDTAARVWNTVCRPPIGVSSLYVLVS